MRFAAREEVATTVREIVMSRKLSTKKRQDLPAVKNIVRYRRADVGGIRIFHREAGRREAPALLLLHGVPSASHMFRDLIPLLAHRYRLVAPDLPGFGQSDMPSRKDFSYTFENLAQVIDRFSDLVGLSRFALYMFDYGAPVGLRIALNRPERITAIVSQNGNAYEEGLSAGWNSLRLRRRRDCGAREDRVRSLVYIAALAPEEGETVANVFYREDPHPNAPKLTPDAHGLLWMPEVGFQQAVAHNASANRTSILAAVQRPIAIHCMEEPAPTPAWKVKPSWFLLAEEDRMINPKTQRFMANRMGARVRSESTDHSPMLTAPALVIDLILGAARETLAA